MQQILKTLARLLQMGPVEIGGRCREQWRAWQERLAIETGAANVVASLPGK